MHPNEAMIAQTMAIAENRWPAGVSAKRGAILAAAERVFLEVGFGLASMEAIARAAGVAKQTLYAHFGTKAALFGATMLERADWLMEPLPAAPEVSDPPAETLAAFATRFLEIILQPESLARLRLVMAERARFPELAEVFYRSGPGRAAAGLADYLGRLDRARVLRVPAPELAASQFLGMVRGDLFLKHLLGLGPKPTPAELKASVQAAVRTFLAAHTRA